MPLYQRIPRNPLSTADQEVRRKLALDSGMVDVQPPYSTQSNSIGNALSGSSVGTRLRIRGGSFAPRQTPVGGKFR